MPSFNDDDISNVIGDIYAAAYGQAQWSHTILQLRDLFGGSRACFCRVGADVAFHDTVATERDQQFDLLYARDHLESKKILEKPVERVSVGAVYQDHALVGGNGLRRSRFWNEWMAPQDMHGGLACKLLVSGQSFWFFDVQRGRGQAEFDAGEVALLGALTPHLIRAAEIGRNAYQARLRDPSLTMLQSSGMMHVDSAMRIVFMNPKAEALATGKDSGLRIKGGILSATNSRADAELRRLVITACVTHDGIAPGSGGDMLIRGEGDRLLRSDTVFSIGPMRGPGPFGSTPAAYATIIMQPITLRLPDDFEMHVRKLFDLSPAEARLAASLTAGQSLKAAAIESGIQFSTARSYLESIFRKTGTRQQSQVVALLKSTQPLIR